MRRQQSKGNTVTDLRARLNRNPLEEAYQKSKDHSTDHSTNYAKNATTNLKSSKF